MIQYNDDKGFLKPNIDTSFTPELEWWGKQVKHMPAWKIFQKFGIIDTYENYKKLMYEMEYTKDLKSKSILKKYQIIHQNIGNIGEPGSVQRYDFLSRYIRILEFDSHHRNAKKITNEVLAILMESVDPQHTEIINAILEGQDELVKSVKENLLPIGAWRNVGRAISLMENRSNHMKSSFKDYQQMINRRYKKMIDGINKMEEEVKEKNNPTKEEKKHTFKYAFKN